MADIVYPRIATVIKETGEVSSIAERSAPPDRDKRQIERDDFDFVPVDYDVRIGMKRQADGSFDWPDGHSNENLAKRRAREAASAKEEVGA